MRLNISFLIFIAAVSNVKGEVGYTLNVDFSKSLEFTLSDSERYIVLGIHRLGLANR
jgi:hypothetical protein